MRILLLSIFVLAFAYASEVSLDMYGFGVSYHTNRNQEWNEKNYGLGVGLSYTPDDSNASLIVLTGGYKDSFNNNATFALLGVNCMFIGNKNEFHTGVMVAGGYINGSGMNPFSLIAAAEIGYDRVSLCLTGTAEAKNNETEEKTGVVVAFVKVRVIDF